MLTMGKWKKMSKKGHNWSADIYRLIRVLTGHILPSVDCAVYWLYLEYQCTMGTLFQIDFNNTLMILSFWTGRPG